MSSGCLISAACSTFAAAVTVRRYDRHQAERNRFVAGPRTISGKPPWAINSA